VSWSVFVSVFVYVRVADCVCENVHVFKSACFVCESARVSMYTWCVCMCSCVIFFAHVCGWLCLCMGECGQYVRG